MTRPIHEPERGGGWGWGRRCVYALAMGLFALLYLPTFIRKGKHGAGFSERLGRLDPRDRARLARASKIIWIHGVSVGEVTLAFRLGGEIRRRQPETLLLYTVTTRTGREVAERLRQEADVVAYSPIDFHFTVRRFMSGWRATTAVLMETEIWPALIHRLDRSGVPVLIANARISDKALPGYGRVRGWIGPVLRQVRRILAQSPEMAERYRRLGAAEGSVLVTGNLKYDWAPPAHSGAETARVAGYRSGPSFVLLAASTHEGEEQILFDIYTRIKAQYPYFRMIIAPRHPERLAAVIKDAERICGGYGLLSGPDASPEKVLLVDKMGVLGSLYPAADVVFVGGSLVPVGGHNPIEPAYFGKPVLFGPWIANFREITADFVKAAAAVRVTDADGLEKEILRLLSDPAERAGMGGRALELVRSQRGALARTVDQILSMDGAGSSERPSEPVIKEGPDEKSVR